MEKDQLIAEMYHELIKMVEAEESKVKRAYLWEVG